MIRYTLEMLKKMMMRNDGWLDLEGCTELTALPDNLTVAGSLDLSGCTGLTALPDNLTVADWLDLSGCTGLTALPDNLTVAGLIYCDGLELKRGHND